MKLRIFFIILICTVLAMFMLPSRKVHSIEDPPCPTENCFTREVSNADDEGDRSLRVVIGHACLDNGDDRIVFTIWDPIELESPIVVPANCNGRLFIYGKANVRNVLDGSRLDSGDDFQDNCMLRIDSNDNEVTNLSFINYRSDDDAQTFPGIGLCLLGNGNRVEHVSSGALPNSTGGDGNDVGIYIRGAENRVLRSQISQNTIDGIWIEGDKNVIQGNYIGDPYEDCSRPSEQDKIESEVVSQEESLKDEAMPTEESQDVDNKLDDGHPNSPASGGCQLISSTTAQQNNPVKIPTGVSTTTNDFSFATATNLKDSFSKIPETIGVTIIDTEKPSNAFVVTTAPLSADELSSVHQAQSQSCLSISNSRYGIRVTKDASDNKIGGFTTGDHNIIAYNGDAGVRLDGSRESIRNTINNNVFYHNGGLGIDEGPERVTLNDKGDGDSGPNTLINFADNLMVIMRTLHVGDRNTYTFTLKGSAPQGSTIEVYLADGGVEHVALDLQGDPSGFGEGEMLLMHFVVQDKPEFEVRLPGFVQRQTKVTTLLTDPEGNTSEFSQNIILEQDSDLDGIIDLYEDAEWNELVDREESDPFNIDTDGDGLLDSVEDSNLNGKRDRDELAPMLADMDHDGLNDYIETKGDGKYDRMKSDTDPFDADTDGDDIKDGDEDKNHNGVVEFYVGETDPRNKDSDADGVEDDLDNCSTMPNPRQRDSNDNNIGDLCEMTNSP